MAVSAERIAVATTAIALNTDVGPVGGTKLVVKNAGTGAVDLGPASVASGAGFGLAVDATVTVDLGPGDQLFAISDTTATVHVLRIG